MPILTHPDCQPQHKIMSAGNFVIRDEDGDIVKRGRRIEGRCAACPTTYEFEEEDGTWTTVKRDKNLTHFYCLCKRSPLLDALELARSGESRTRGAVCWICLRCLWNSGGELSCLSTHMGLSGELVEV